MARLILGIVLALSFAAIPRAAPVSAVLQTGARAVVDVAPGSRVNVRATPEITAGNVVGKAPAGTIVAVLERAKRGEYIWYRVRALDGSVEGWVRGDLLEPREEEVASPPEEPPAADGIGSAGAGQKMAAAAPDEPPARPRPEHDWSLRLRELLPAIDGCLAQSSAKPARVLKARPMPLELVEVILEDASERYWSCIIGLRGGTPLTYSPVPGPTALLGARPNPVFVRQPKLPEPDACHDVEPVRDERDGTVIGALIYNVCS